MNHLCGITGLAGSGKSRVSGLLFSFGYPVINLDKIGHEALNRPEVRPSLQQAFGRAVISGPGRVNRQVLGKIVFSDPAALALLSRITWPVMHDLLSIRIRQLKSHSCELSFLEAAVLFPGGFDRHCSVSVWVDCPHDILVKRLSERGGRKKAESILRSQENLYRYKEECALVIDNSGSVENLRAQVDSLSVRIKALLSY